jgi:hypothetical protein
MAPEKFKHKGHKNKINHDGHDGHDEGKRKKKKTLLTFENRRDEHRTLQGSRDEMERARSLP